MFDLDTRILQEKYENIFAGTVDDDDDVKDSEDDESDEPKKKKKKVEDDIEDENDENDEDDEDLGDDIDDEEDEDAEDELDDSDSDEYEDEENEDEEDEEGSEDDIDEYEGGDEISGDTGTTGGSPEIKGKLKALQKQYNDILVSAFEKYATDAIENALNNTEVGLGMDIVTVINDALDEIRTNVLDDLGVEDTTPSHSGEDIDTTDIAPYTGDLGLGRAHKLGLGLGLGGGLGKGLDGGMEFDLGDEPDVKFGSNVGGVPTIVDDEDEEDEDEEDED